MGRVNTLLPSLYSATEHLVGQARHWSCVAEKKVLSAYNGACTPRVTIVFRVRCLSLDSPMKRYAPSTEKAGAHVYQAYLRKKICEGRSIGEPLQG